MSIHWASLLIVFVVSSSSTVAVVVLVTVAMLGLSARAARSAGPRVATWRPPFSPLVGTAVAWAGLSGAAVIVTFGLWAIVVR
jgi:hypothetical protein